MKSSLITRFSIILIALIILEVSSTNGFLKPIISPLIKKEIIPLDFEVKEVSEELGLTNTHVKLPSVYGRQQLLGWFQSNGAGVSIADVNNDGYQDVLALNNHPNSRSKLFLNVDGKKFVEAAEEFGLHLLNIKFYPMRSIFFDCNNDGFKDLFVVGSGCPRVYKNIDGRKFTQVAQDDIKCFRSSYSSNAIDIDKDGDLDLVYARYLNDDLDLPNHTFDANKGPGVAVMENLGSCNFKERGDTGIPFGLYTQAISIADLNGDQLDDLWFATDHGSDQVFLNNGDFTFTNRSSELTNSFSRHGMGADIAYLFDQEHPSVYVSHVFEPSQNIEGNSLWTNIKFEPKNIAHKLGIDQCNFSWGSKFFDINNDSHKDLIVTTGFIGGRKDKTYNFLFGTLSSSSRMFMGTTENWPPIGDRSVSSFQRGCLFLSYKGKFKDVALQTVYGDNLDDGRAVALFDHDNDGSQGYVVSYIGKPLRFYDVRQKNNHNWIGVNLTGRCSNRDALGSLVKVTLSSGRVLRTNLQPQNGFSTQSDSRLHFGLGNDVAKEIEILWPSGITQTVNPKKMNHYINITEDESCYE